MLLGFLFAMLKTTERKLYGAIDFLESALDESCRQAVAAPDKVTRAKDLIREAIMHERKVTDGH